MYPEYPQYVGPYYPPPMPPTPRRRPNMALRLGVSVTAMLLTLCVALCGVGVVVNPQLVARLVPLAAVHVTGTIYGQQVAQREAGAQTPLPVAGAIIDCGKERARSDAKGHYSLTLLRARAYSCDVSAAHYAPSAIQFSPRISSAYQLDMGPTVASTSADCAVGAIRETCPALALVGSELSGKVTEGGSSAPIAHATVDCWDDSSAGQAGLQPPTRYSTTTDTQGHYTLRDTPPGPYLCVANQQGSPQQVDLAPATTTTADFSVCGSNCGGATFHQGIVLHTFTAYIIFWAPPGRDFEPGGDNSRFESLTQQYFADVGGTSFYGLLTQYWDQSGPVRNVAAVGGTYVDTQSYPHAGTRANPLTDDDVSAEIGRVRKVKGWGDTPGTTYVVVTAYNVQECAKYSNGTTCSFPSNGNTGFCAYHSFVLPDATATESLPYIYAADNYDCGYLPTFNDNPAPYGDQQADSVINSLSHEQFEVVTDPMTHGWYDGDPSTGEIGDKCETAFGATDWNGATVTLNHGHSYVLQEEYSNLAGGCAYQ